MQLWHARSLRDNTLLLRTRANVTTCVQGRMVTVDLLKKSRLRVVSNFGDSD